MNRVRLVVAVAVTFAFASVGLAAGATGDPLILGQVNDSGGSPTDLIGSLRVSDSVQALRLEAEAPLFYHGASDSTGIVIFAPGTTRQKVSLLSPVLPFEEAFMFLEPLGVGAARFSTSSRYIPSQDAFNVAIDRPAPAGGLSVAYHVVIWGEP